MKKIQISPDIKNITRSVFYSSTLSLFVGFLFFYYSIAPHLNNAAVNPAPEQVYLKKEKEAQSEKDNTSIYAQKNQESSQEFSPIKTVADVVKKSAGAVVSVVGQKESPVYQTYLETSPYTDFFGFPVRYERQRQVSTEKKQVGSGTGFFVRKDGIIVTNRHVVQDTGATYEIRTDTKSYPATVIYRDPNLDIAFLKVVSASFPVLEISTKKPELGQSVVAIGNALGTLQNTISQGIVSGLDRSITAANGFSFERLDSLIQTDAAINQGNSGGPLLSMEGAVIGLNVATVSGGQSIGFAIPIGEVARILGTLR